MKKYIQDFIICHEGIINKLLHIVGIILAVLGLVSKDLILFIVGLVIQEFGHFYQYQITKDKKYSPFHCSLPQLILVGPLFIVAILYILS